MAVAPETPRKVLVKRSVNSPSKHGRAGASPQVKAALAARRKAKASTQDNDDDWGLPSEAQAIEQAKKTGKLNLSARQLDSLPADVFMDLVPRESRFHPARHTGPNVELDMESIDQAGRTMWYEQVELKHFIAPNNLFTEVPTHIGGMKELETLELQGNKLARLPDSLVMLTLLTVVNLSSNNLTAFPTPLLSLRNLRDLNLSNNGLTQLWLETWQEDAQALEDRVKVTSPSATPESTGNVSTNLFWGKQASPLAPARPPDSPPSAIDAPIATPLPSLRTLRVAENKLKELPKVWPRSLRLIDLSTNALKAVDLGGLAQLRRLESLNLASNALRDGDFARPPPSGGRPFQALNRLDLSLNGFETLGFLEAYVDRPIEYDGLPKLLKNLVAAGRVDATAMPLLHVRIVGNTLVDERQRRRDRFKDTASEPQLANEVAVDELAKDIKAIDLDEHSHLDSSREAIELNEHSRCDSSHDAEEAEVPTATDETDEAVDMMSRHIQASVCNLERLQLEQLPVPTIAASQNPLYGVTDVKLSHNRIPTLDFGQFARAWQWQDSLTTVELRNCKLVSFACDITLPNVKTLDLSVNSLTQEVLSTVAKAMPSLRTLNLSRNRLTTLSGTEALFDSCKSLRELHLEANKIENVDALARAAERRLVHTPVLLNLVDNEIARLPVELGHLPLGVSLLVAGNTFRVPRREVYESGGDKLISWLKDRLS